MGIQLYLTYKIQKVPNFSIDKWNFVFGEPEKSQGKDIVYMNNKNK